MSKSHALKQAVRCALLFGATASLTYVPAASAAASSSQSPANLGKVEVTGTRIKRTDVETSQPITRLSRKQLDSTGLTTVGDLLQNITSAGAALNTLDNFSGNFTFTGGGESNIDLRYLDAKRVLVLVNGRRWIKSLGGTVDINTVPLSIVDHVEVLQDGASAIYGSDAIAGVVNIITKKNFNGEQASGYAGAYKASGQSFDGARQAYNFTVGRTNDDSSLLWNIAYTKQNSIHAGNREISKEPVFGTGKTRGSSGTPQGRFAFIPLGGPLISNGACPPNASGQPSCDLTLKQGTTGNNINDYKQFTDNDRFNYAPYNYVLTPDERISSYVQGEIALTDNVNFSGDFLYQHRRSGQQSAPTPLFFASTSLNIDIPQNQPYNPFGFGLTTEGDSPNLQLIGRRFVENGARRFTEAENVFRFSGGFNGNFTLFERQWDWNVNAVFSKDNETDTNFGRFNTNRLQNALGDPALCRSITGCVPLNLFGGQGPNGEGSITQAQLNYIGFTEQDTYGINQRIYEGNISSSDLFDLPGGPLGVAFGYQYRKQNGFFQPDALAVEGNDSFNPGIPVPPTSGNIQVNSEYIEFDVPLLSDLPGAQLLDIDAATRHSNYSSFGGTTNSRIGVKYQPIHDLLLRASWSQGFRAPNINELFAGNTNVSTQLQDPCSNYTESGVSSEVQQRCAAAGIPASYTQANSQVNVLEGGNPNLDAESSISKTIGFVYSPSWLEGFNFNADYYRIDLESTIQPRGAQNLVDACYIAGDQNACSVIDRSTFGGIATLNDQQTNIGGTFTDGADAEVRYKLPSTAFGDFTLDSKTTYIKSFKQFFPTATGGRTTTGLVGLERGGTVFPFGIPRYKSRFDVFWSYANWSADLTARYIDDLTEPCSDSLDGTPNSLPNLGLCSNVDLADKTKSRNHIGSVTYFDFQATYHWNLLNTDFTVGAKNLLDHNPPSSNKQQLNSFDPTLYDVPGRYLYGRVTVRF